MTYARARLLVGIFGVGTWVLISFFGLIVGIPERLFVTLNATPNDWVAAVLLLVTVYTLVSAPFDFLGGYQLPRSFGRKAHPFGRWLKGWLRGVVAHTLILVAIGLALVLGAQNAGSLGFIIVGIAIMIIQLFWQVPIANLLSHHTKLSSARHLMQHVRLRFAKSFDPSFTGGIYGPPGAEVVVVPESWLRKMKGPVHKAALARRIELIRSGARLDGLIFALGFNGLGITLCALFTRLPLDNPAGLVHFMMLFTLWSFLGLLLLPSFSREAVFYADKVVSKRFAEPLKEYIRRVDHLLDDEPARSKTVETIFHPIPSVARRIERIKRPVKGRPAPWHTARTAVYLSWAGLSLLSRAVHCNAGKPELWVFLPAD